MHVGARPLPAQHLVGGAVQEACDGLPGLGQGDQQEGRISLGIHSPAFALGGLGLVRLPGHLLEEVHGRHAAPVVDVLVHGVAQSLHGGKALDGKAGGVRIGVQAEVMGGVPAPAAIGLLVAVDLEDPIADVAIQIRQLFPVQGGHGARLHQICYKHIGHEAGQGLFHTAIGVADEVGQRGRRQVFQVAHGREDEGCAPLGHRRCGDSQALCAAIQDHGTGERGGDQLIQHRDTLALGILEIASLHPGRDDQGPGLVREERQGQAELALILEAEAGFRVAREATVLHIELDLALEGLARKIAHQGDGPSFFTHT